MPNHVHLILVPETKDGLNLVVGKAHKRYTRRINFREGWRGHLWQGRFASFVMDDNYLLSCTKYIELNPVRAGLVKRPEEWPFSSARAHIEGRDGILIKSKPMTDRISKPWGMFLSDDVGEHEMHRFRKHERTGRPMGGESFIDKLVLREPLAAARQAGVPSMLHVRESLEHAPDMRAAFGMSADAIRAQVLESADVIVANSEFTADNFRKKDATFVVNNIVD